MARNHIAQKVAQDLYAGGRVLGPGRGVIDSAETLSQVRISLRNLPQICLECVRILPQVVPQPGHAPPLPGIELRGEDIRPLSYLPQMFA